MIGRRLDLVQRPYIVLLPYTVQPGTPFLWGYIYKTPFLWGYSSAQYGSSLAWHSSVPSLHPEEGPTSGKTRIIFLPGHANKVQAYQLLVYRVYGARLEGLSLLKGKRRQ